MTRHFHSIFLSLFFLSGFTGLCYEICWIRSASQIFGSTNFAVSSVVDAIANQYELSTHDKVDWIIKWNPRKQNAAAWAQQIFAEGTVVTPRPGKRVGTMSVKERHTFTDPDGIEKNITLRRVVRIPSQFRYWRGTTPLYFSVTSQFTSQSTQKGLRTKRNPLILWRARQDSNL